ncbi:IclR family transcriptional regulator [Nitriliruptor alkaliphilus]|uniref:IclR family transcriptional regulator n=1 Tax=Nitriliruptor alkaliphilus TaxID=427918 RepID=UPI000695AA08|nr:IclR family transcriptional regulator [Nitriliruptor alkaliphilus]
MTVPRQPASERTPNAIGKVAAVVSALTDERTTSGIARRTGLPSSTVHRILQDLVAVGWAREDGNRGYLLGARLLALAGRATDQASLVRVAHPTLQELSDRTGHAVHFAVRTGDEAVYVDKIEGNRAYQMRSRVGLAIPLHCTAIGKALLAALPEVEARAVLTRAGMPPRTTHTITSADEMLGHLELVRDRGYSFDDEENELSTRCIGAAVRDHSGTAIGGVSLSMLAFELEPDRVRPLASLVVRTAARITSDLGGS